MEDTNLSHEDAFFLPYNSGFICFVVLAVFVPMVDFTRLCCFSWSLFERIRYFIVFYPIFAVFRAGPVALIIALGLYVQGMTDGGVPFIMAIVGSLVTIFGMCLSSKLREEFRKNPATILIYLLTSCVTAGFILLAVYCNQMDIVDNTNTFAHFGPMRITDVQLGSESFEDPNGGYNTVYDVRLELSWGGSWGCNDDTWCKDSVTIHECKKRNSADRTQCFQESEYGESLDGFIFEKETSEYYNEPEYDRDVEPLLVPDDDPDWRPFIFAYGNCNNCKARLRSDLARVLHEALKIKAVGIALSLIGLVVMLLMIVVSKIKGRIQETEDIGDNQASANGPTPILCQLRSRRVLVGSSFTYPAPIRSQVHSDRSGRALIGSSGWFDTFEPTPIHGRVLIGSSSFEQITPIHSRALIGSSYFEQITPTQSEPPCTETDAESQQQVEMASSLV